MKNNKELKTKELLPALRFPEFKEYWINVCLKNLVDEVNEKNTNYNQNILTLSSENGLVLQTEYFNKRIAGKETAKYTLIKKDDFVYNDRSTTKFLYGTIRRLSNFDNGIVSPIYLVFRPRELVYPAYLEYYFQCSYHLVEMNSIIDQGARFGRFNINANKFFSINILFPSLPEQQKIADCLSSLDELIAAHSEKLCVLKDHKKGLMQRLFPGEGETVPNLRFPEFKDEPEWEITRLSEIFLERITKNNPQKQVLAATQDKGVIPYKLLKKTIIRNNDNLVSYKLVCKKDFVISLRSFEGGIEYSNHEGIISPAYSIIFPNKPIIEYFFKVFFKTDSFIKSIQNNLNNSLRDGKTITYKQASELYVIFPSLPEQQKIADCLSSLDELIAAEDKKIACLKEHKKGLMQRLFPAPDEDIYG